MEVLVNCGFNSSLGDDPANCSQNSQVGAKSLAAVRYMRTSISAYAATLVAVLMIGGTRGQAATLFRDTFNRPDSRNIDAELTGITDNTGSSLAANGVYTHALVDPSNADPINGVEDGNALDGGGAELVGGALRLAVGAGTSNAFVNHNFTNPEILAHGGFSVSADIVAAGGYQQGGAFAIGMTQAEAFAGGDAFNEFPAVDPDGPAYTWAFNATPPSTPQQGLPVGNVVSDFWVGLRGDSSVIWGGHSGTASVVDVGASSGTIGATFSLSSFDAGATVDYEVFFNGGSIGNGSFNWSDSNANYIGLDANDDAFVAIDSFGVESSSVPTLTVNRGSGNILLSNTTPDPLSMVAYSITTANSAFDLAEWNTIEAQNLDLDDEWITLTDTSNPTAPELTEGTLGEYTLGALGTATDSIDFGNAWIPVPTGDEDIAIELVDASDNPVPVHIQYVSEFGDYDGSGSVDAGDWPNVRDNLISDVSEFTPLQRYLRGDLTGDGLVNQLDFRKFKQLFEANQGIGSFAALLRSTPVPEPAAMFLLASGIVGLPLWRRRAGRLALVVGALAIGCSAANQAHAVVLFADTFNRMDDRNIDASLTGVTDNTGSTLPTDGVYTQPHVDPVFEDTGDTDGDAANGGGAQILTGELQLAVGPGTSNAFVNHNFTNAGILAAGGFSVSLDVAGLLSGSTGSQYGGGFAIGMSQGEAATAGDAAGGGGGPPMTSGLSVGSSIGSGVDDAVVSDFWMVLRADSTLAWGTGSGQVQGLHVGASTGTISAKFATESFAVDRSVAYEVFFAGALQGSGSFFWSDDIANFIGVDANDTVGVRLDNLQIETASDAAVHSLRLIVNTQSGDVSLAGGVDAADLDFYEIRSADGGLLDGSFTGLQAAGFEGWDRNGAIGPTSLSESYLGPTGTEFTTIAAGASAVSLGAVYDTVGGGTQDLRLYYYDVDGNEYQGYVEYVSSLLPDFNGDGMVNLADYTVWRDNLGATGVSFAQGDATGDGNVTMADYKQWKAHFGEVVASVSALSAATVPEPSTLVVACLAAAAMWWRRQL